MSASERIRAAEIVAALGPEWRLSSDEEQRVHLIGPGVVLYCNVVSYGPQKGRLEIGLSEDTGLLHHYHYQDKRPVMGFGPSRTTASIAKDITRRLLPQAIATLANLRERQTQADARESQKRELLVRLATALGVEAPEPDSYQGRDNRLRTWVGPQRINVDTESHGDTATLKLGSVPADVAMAVCKLLREMTS